MTKEHTAFFLQRTDGTPIRFVLGECCPCSSMSLATFFPDLITAMNTCAAHCDGDTEVAMCKMTVEKIPKSELG